MAKSSRLKQGYDVGNGYTKWEGNMFASRVKIGQNKLLGNNSSATNVIYKGERYIVGQGRTFVEKDRHFHLNYELCLLTAIAKRNKHLDTINIDICVGLPINIYMEDEREGETLLLDKLIEKFENKDFEITLNIDGVLKEYNINIGKVDVFMEGAYPIYKNDTCRSLTIDIGSGTVNVTEFNELGIVEFNTYKKGMEVLCGVVKKKLDLMIPFSNVTKERIDEIFIKDGFINTNITVKDEVIMTAPIKEIIQEFVDGVWSDIENDFNLGDISKIYLMGGGCLSVGAYYKNSYPSAEIVNNAQNINTTIYEKVTESDE